MPGKERGDTSQSGACAQRCLFLEFSSFDSDQQPKRREIALVSGDVMNEILYGMIASYQQGQDGFFRIRVNTGLPRGGESKCHLRVIF
ncbi:MAG: hypothetical protein ACO3JG_08000 [Luteolibacter sp.]